MGGGDLPGNLRLLSTKLPCRPLHFSDLVVTSVCPASGGRPCDRLAQLPRLIMKIMDEVCGVGQFGGRLIDSEP